MQNYPLQTNTANPETCPQAFRGNQFPGNSNQEIPIIIPNRIPDGYLYTNMGGVFQKDGGVYLVFQIVGSHCSDLFVGLFFS